MATLYVRNVPTELYDELKRWAEESGRSVNAEVLAVLEAEAGRRGRHGDWLADLDELRRELDLPADAADEAIAAIRAHRDAGL